ncbi:putative kxDL motif-containing protein 1 [Apostichopus japonicus]|uniref:Putative kxDL motif-containing protein 1 n=1 Tax=Stichopus japonicus TaxID=307972 RepID=A0A2G8KVR5_STIJA|nr:putative kxDL motif-containing protein 1 [Apostichopus japonicus]
MMSKTSPMASDAFLGSLTSMTNDEDMQGILDAQNHMLGRFEKTNEMLSNFNSLSSQRYNNVHQQFTGHTQLLLDMKGDLDAIFRRLRSLKGKLARDYPRAFSAAIEDEKKPDLGEGDHDNEGASQINQVRTIDGDVEEKEEPDGAREHNDQMDEKGELTSTSNNSTNGAKVTNSEPPVYLVD